MTVEIESVLVVPADDVLAALSAGGLEATLLATDPCLRLDVDADDTQIGHALEGLTAGRRLSLVPDRVGEHRFVLRPPTA
jgi:hypothetical protein